MLLKCKLMLLKCQIHTNMNKNGFLLPTKCLMSVQKKICPNLLNFRILGKCLLLLLLLKNPSPLLPSPPLPLKIGVKKKWSCIFQMSSLKQKFKFNLNIFSSCFITIVLDIQPAQLLFCISWQRFFGLIHDKNATNPPSTAKTNI